MDIINRAVISKIYSMKPRSVSCFSRSIRACLGGVVIATLLAGCAGQKTQEEIQAGRYRLKQDSGHKNIDVTRIPDAVPRSPEGSVKADPYSLNGISYTPLPSAAGYKKEGLASWYGVKFHGYETANGEIYDMYGMSAAHKTLPLPSYVRVTNLSNNRSVIVRVNDRGPFYGSRIIDLSWAAAKKLGYHKKGTAKVRVEGIDTSPEGLLALQATAAGNKPAVVLKVKSAPRLEQTFGQKLESSTEDLVDGEQLYLQVAALSSRDGAAVLQNKLLNITNAPVKIVSGTDALFRVRVGPFGSEQDLVGLQKTLQNASMAKGHRVYE